MEVNLCFGVLNCQPTQLQDYKVKTAKQKNRNIENYSLFNAA